MTRIFSTVKQVQISHVIDFKFQHGLEYCLLGKKIKKNDSHKKRNGLSVSYDYVKTNFKFAEKNHSQRAEESFEKNLKPRFKWVKEERINNLMQCMLSYNSEMEFERKDFNADKVKLYESVRQKMAKIYVYKLSSLGALNLERYLFMGRVGNSLDKI